MTSDTKEHGEKVSELDQYVAILDQLLGMNSMFTEVKRLRDYVASLRQRPTPERPPHQREGGIAKEPKVFTHGLTLTAADIEEIAGTGPGPAVAAVHPSITQELREAMEIVNEQAEDEGLWFEAEYITEAVLQAALRRLHAALESAARATSGRAASAAKGKP